MAITASLELFVTVLHADDDLHATASGRSLDKRRVELLKFVLCSGLYPHFAAPDRLNSVRKIAEQVRM